MLEAIKTLLNGILHRLKIAERNAAEAKKKVDAVGENPDWDETNPEKHGYIKNKPSTVTEYLIVNLENKGQGGTVIDTPPRKIAEHIKSGGNVSAWLGKVQYGVFVVCEEPICLMFYTLESDGFAYIVWDTEDLRSFASYKKSIYLGVDYIGTLRWNGNEIVSCSGYVQSSWNVSDWRFNQVPISNNAASSDAYILITLSSADEMAGVRFDFGKQLDVLFVDSDATDFQSVTVKNILLHVTLLNESLMFVKDVFYGDDMDGLICVSVDKAIYRSNASDGDYFWLRYLYSLSKYNHSSASSIDNVDVTTYIM